MLFINPVEILNLAEIEIELIDNVLVKKAKRKLFTEIELSDDGLFDYHDQKVTKSDCESAIDELEKKSNREFYYFLANHTSLNQYLIDGNEKVFTSFQQESIFQLDEFKSFIAPYFLTRYDKSILSAFKTDNYLKLITILRGQSLLGDSNFINGFKSLSFELDSRISSIEEITKKIKSKDTTITKDSIKSILGITKSLFPVEILNALPGKVFQSLLNKIAVSINFLQLAIDNELGETDLSLSLLEYILDLQISSISLPTFLNNLEILRRRRQVKIEREQNAPILKKWANVTNELNQIRTSIEDKSLTPNAALTKLNQLLNLNELNNLPAFGDEIRDEVALCLRGLSVGIWNTWSNIDVATLVIGRTNNINTSIAIKELLSEAILRLDELKETQRANEIIEIEELIKVLTNVNNQIAIHGMVNMKSDKIKALLNDLFTTGVINMLSVSNEQYLRRKLFGELERLLVKLDAFFTNNFLKKIKPLGDHDGELALKIQNGVSGIGFVSKNVANNVGTGLGKANKAMVNNLPSQIVGWIYLIIIMAIIGGICSLAGC